MTTVRRVTAGAPTEPALLRLLRVKGDLLSFHIGDQLFGPVDCDWINYRERYSPIPLDLFVEFDALLTHCNSAFVGGSQHWLLSIRRRNG